MRRLFFPRLLLGLVLGLSGCVPPAAPTPTAPPAPTATPVPLLPTLAPTATPAALTVDQLQNATYLAPQYAKIVTLVGGQFEAGAGADYFSARLLEFTALGDLNGDGVDDAAVLLAENGGGSGTFVSVIALLNQGGQPAQAGAALIDDRPQVTAFSIENGRLVVQAVIHGFEDAMCCPTFPVTETYAWSPNGLALVRLASQTPAGTERSLQIESPAPGAQVSGRVQVQGRFTITPFENSLVYRLLDAQGNLLAQGPFMAGNPDSGGPGTFDAPIDISALPAGTAFRLELFDASAADGSPLALDSVNLAIK